MSVRFNLLGSDKASPLPRPHALERRGRQGGLGTRRPTPGSAHGKAC